MSHTHRLARLVAVAVAVVTVTTGVAAGAQDDLDATPLLLVDTTPWISPGEQLSISVRPRLPADTVGVTVYDKVRSRFELLQTISTRSDADPIHEPAPRDTVDVTDASGVTQLIIRTVDAAAVADVEVPPDVVPVDAGVYPIVVETSTGDGDERVAVERLYTHMIVLDPTSSPQPMLVAPLVRLDAEISMRADGTTIIDEERAGSHAALVDALTTTGSLTLDVHPEMADAYLRAGPPASGVVDAIRALGTQAEWVERPYAHVDVGDWLATDLFDEVDRQLRSGRDSLTSLLGSTIAQGVWIADSGADPDLLGWLDARRSEHLVIPESSLEPLDIVRFPLTITNPFGLTSANDDVAAMSTNETLARHLRDEDPVLGAHTALADLVVLAAERPTSRRGVILRIDEATQPDAYRMLVESMEGVSGLALTTVSDLFATLPRAHTTVEGARSPLVRTVVDADTEVLSSYLSAVRFADPVLTSYADFVANEPTRVAPLVDLLLVSGDAGLDDAERDEYFTSFYAIVDDAVDQVSITATDAIRITAHEAEIPIVVENGLGSPANIVLVLDSDKLEFPDGELVEITLEPGVNREISVPVRARSSGDSTLLVGVRSRDQTLSMDQTQITVRSTAISGLGLAIGLAALGVLCIWWGREILRSRRAR